MITVDKDTKAARCAWWAAQDASMRNIAAKSKYTPQVHLQVERMKAVLDYCYGGRIFEAYRPKSVAVKIDKPWVKNKQMLSEIEADWAQRGITKTVTPQGVLYRLP
jgi:hypothetical protein